jgi:transporter family protein
MTWLQWSLLSALFAAVTAVFAKLGVKGLDANLATAIRTTVVVVLSWGVAAATSGAAGVSSVSGRTWIYLILSGLATGLSWLCYFHALQAGPLTRVAPVDKLSVALTILLGIAVFGESLTWKIAGGAALIVAGVLLIAME